MPDSISHYRVIEPIGAGGMCVVFAAEDLVLGRRVALKCPREGLHVDPSSVARFVREARTASAVNHPNICTIYEAGVHAGRPFLAMELIDGTTLRERLQHGPLDPAELLRTALDVLDAISAVHAAGFVHRDIKPGNIMITRAGHAKLMDFGLVKLAHDDGSSPSALGGMPTETLLTGDGAVVGTLAYMSPEQARAQPLDRRSDLFSFGVVLYEMATGRRPFDGDRQALVFDALFNREPPPIAAINAAMPAALQRVVDTALAKSPDRRYQSAIAMRRDLLRIGAPVPVAAPQPPPPTPPAHPRPISVSVAIGAVAVTIGIAALVWWGRAPAVPAARPSFASMTLEPVTRSGSVQLGAIAPNGQFVVHTETDGAMASLWMRQVATASHVQIVAPAEGEFDGVTISTDGQYVFYVWYPKDSAKGDAYRVPSLGGPPQLVIQDVDTPLAISPDERSLAFVRAAGAGSALLIADARGRIIRTLAERAPPKQFLPIDLGWSPDGGTIALAERDRRDASVRLVAIDAETGQEHALTRSPWYGFSGLVWLPDGRGLIVTGSPELAPTSGNQAFLVPWPVGPEQRITRDLASYSTPRISADGRALLLVREERNARLWVVMNAGATMTPIGVLGDGVSGLDVASDGSIVFVSMATGQPDLWLKTPNEAARQLTFDQATELAPHFTGDARAIIFYVIRGGRSMLGQVARDGSADRPLAATTPRSWNAPTSPWPTPDGRWILVTDAVVGIGRVSSNPGESPQPLPLPALATHGTPVSLLALSRDGRQLAVSYLDRAVRRTRVAVLSSDGTSLRARLDLPGGAPGVGGRSLDFSADARFLYFSTFRNGAGNIFKVPVDGGPEEQVTRFQADPIVRFAVSPDDATIAASRGASRSDVVMLRAPRP